ncbi:DUF1289 domain-containing protein [Rhodophyticola sp.]|jgi:predicted Fe-S protein YdhL (DUF1289 family)|uniref:DUF1289 domain-containing protein n=1 Tax=Rhodophyticola sp. TaxID=2680032 RepID=UPI003D296611
MTDDDQNARPPGPEVWKRDEIESPCIKICVVHPETRLCTGCNRSIEEITNWSRMAPDARARIMAELPTRAPLLKKRRGGRAARLSK